MDRENSKNLIFSLVIIVGFIGVLSSAYLFLKTLESNGEEGSGKETGKQTEQFDSSKHFSDPTPVSGIELIVQKMQPLPKGEGWSIEYQESTKIFKVSVDAGGSYDTYENKTKEALNEFTKKGYDPCKEPLAQSILIEPTNMPTIPPAAPAWEPCK